MSVAGGTTLRAPPATEPAHPGGLGKPRAVTPGGGAPDGRILALVGPGRNGKHVVRRAKALSDGLGVPWIALHLERVGHVEDARAALEVATQLGAEVEIRSVRTLERGVVAFAASRHVTCIVVGESRLPRFPWFRGKSFAAALLRQGGGMTVHVVALPQSGRQLRPALDGEAGGYRPWFNATAVVLGVIVLGEIFHPWVHPETMGMVFLAAVVAAAAFYGLGVALYASALGLLSWLLLFIPPIYRLTIYETRDVLAAFVFVGIAAVTGWLASRVRTEARTARARLDNLRRILVFSRKLGEPMTQEHLLEEITRQASLVAGEAIVLTVDAGSIGIRAASRGTFPTLDVSSWAAARSASTRHEPAGRDTAMLSAAPWLFLPLRSGQDLRGILGVLSEKSLHEPQLQALSALADQAAAALERVQLAASAARTEAQAETQKLRTALLNALSHDLRTPLTSIRGAAGSLRSAWDRLPSPVRLDLLASIEEDTIRMTRFLTNIMDMTRLESDQIVPRSEHVGVADAIGEALGRLPLVQPVRVDLPAGLPPMRADETLLEHVLVNVLENARKYSLPDQLIRVGAAASRDAVRIEIADEGVGIAPDDLPHVFDSFYRAKREDRIVPGTGLGLAIARGLMEAMGGSIEAASPRPDAVAGLPPGTVVTLTLPVAA